MILPDTFVKNTRLINVVVETPSGSNIKYKYEVEHGYFKLHKFMPMGMIFPFDFGFIPHTKASDGDPLDALVLCDFPAAIGCVVECRLIGVMMAKQKEKSTEYFRNDRLITVAETSLKYASIKSIKILTKIC